MKNIENRISQRYKELGRVIAEELCPLAGILSDISAEGCKVHFPAIVVANLENEYELKITPSHNLNESPLKLLCSPKWVLESENSTDIGFNILYSPDALRLSKLIENLQKIAESEDDEADFE